MPDPRRFPSGRRRRSRTKSAATSPTRTRGFTRSSAATWHRSPLYSGQIQGIGPRYCPSIEDKVVKFRDKDRHQIVLEPEGVDTHEIYVNGMSTSLPIDVQREILSGMKGLESAQMIRPGYAIEYDFVQPTELHPSLETKKIAGSVFRRPDQWNDGI